MKKELLFAGLFILSLFSCNNDDVAVPENDPSGEGVELVVQAVMGNEVTKTVVQNASEGHADIYWTREDAINLFYGDVSSGKFTTTITSPAASATFHGTISAVTGTTETGGEACPFWGVYPYSASNTCDGSGVTLTIPGTQSGVAGSFATNLNPTVATSMGLDLAFYNVGSWFKFSVSRNDIVSVTLRGNNSEDIAGTVRVEMDQNSRPSVTQVTDGITSITLTPAAGGTFTPGQEYYMVLIPQTLSEGYSLTLTTSNGLYATCVISGSMNFERSKFRAKLNADSELSFNIAFRDSKVKDICVAIWDTNQDGELSIGEAAAVTLIPYGIFNGTEIEYFDEFKFFTGLTSALGYKMELVDGKYDYYGTFYDCEKLKSITLPSTLTTIPCGCFRLCTALEEITIPSSVSVIHSVAFLDCENLNVYMVSETPCTLAMDYNSIYSLPYTFGLDSASGVGRVKAIYVPSDAATAYINATYWSAYKDLINVDPSQFKYVDLGLSIKWATRNVGATKPEEYGDYFAWGETEPYYEAGYAQEDPQNHWKEGKSEGYEWWSYMWCEDSFDALTKYCYLDSYGNDGFTDNKTVLDLEDDVAHVKWGGNWRMPTKAELDELCSNCTWTWYSSGNTEFNGVAGYKVTSKMDGYLDRFIFLPSAGCRFYKQLESVGDAGGLWSSSLYMGTPDRALAIYFNYGGVYADSFERIFGLSVRPVCP